MTVAAIALLLCSGVAGVSGTAATEAPVRQHIQDAVQRSDPAAAAETRVTVDVVEGAVLLRGSVRLYQQKLSYEQAAWQAPAVREVENEIAVVPWYPVSDAEIERQITALAKRDRFQGIEWHVQVRDGVVSIGATFHEPADVFALKHLVAAIEGVRELSIQARFGV